MKKKEVEDWRRGGGLNRAARGREGFPKQEGVTGDERVEAQRGNHDLDALRKQNKASLTILRQGRSDEALDIMRQIYGDFAITICRRLM